MVTLYNRDARQARARDLESLNGIDFALISLQPSVSPTKAVLELHFFNDQHLDDLANTVTAHPDQLWPLLPISGGSRIPAGPLFGQVQVTAAAHTAPQVLALDISPVGDYSRYTLTIQAGGFDPIFGQFVFRFRPGCFSSNCNPRVTNEPALPEPAIDYLAKDYESFRHTLIAAMMQRVPDWQPTSEAAFDVVLIDLLSAAGDELSDYQDRVMNEAYWSTARDRISLRRHARLMDYFIHAGSQASTALAIDMLDKQEYILPAGTQCWSGYDPTLPDSVWFISAQPQLIHGALSSISLYTWSDVIPALETGATSADLAFPDHATAVYVRGLINNAKLTRLLIQEWLNPATGRPPDRDPNKRQILRLTADAQLLTDPLTGDPVLRVSWREEDQLQFNYCFVVQCETGTVRDVSLFHGNLVDVVQGKRVKATYVAPGTPLSPGVYDYKPLANGATIGHLPNLPVLWQQSTPGGYEPSRSTVEAVVQDSSGDETWDEQTDLIHSNGTSDAHFVVETDENLRSRVRFGDGTNGRPLPESAIVKCTWLTGLGQNGNIGLDTLLRFDTSSSPLLDGSTCWNPFDITNGLAPESPEIIRRRVPEAYLLKQSRAVTLRDYEARAEEVDGVSRAAASYSWTGSWRTVRVCVDPVGTTKLSDELRVAVEERLDAMHLIGEDIEVRAPQFVPLKISVNLCLGNDYWIEDVRPFIVQAFSDGYNYDGTPAFFHPDGWTFGQALYASQIEGVLENITGVEHVIAIDMARWWDLSVHSSEVITVAPSEIILVRTDPDRMEDGFIEFTLKGGRQ